MKNNFLLILCCIFFFVGCTNKTQKNYVSPDEFGVQWYSGFTLSENLKNPITPETQSSIRGMLKKQLNREYKVIIENNSETTATISTCSDYFYYQSDIINTLPENDYNNFRSVALMCHAAKLIANAQPVLSSNLVYPLNGEKILKQFPPHVAYIASESFRKELLTDPSITSLLDALNATQNTVTSINRENRNQFLFETQQNEIIHISLIARGDFSRNGTEEILLLSKQHLEMPFGYSMETLYILKPDKESELFMFVDEIYF